MTRRLVIFVSGDFTVLENGSHVRMAELVDFARSNFPDVAVYSHFEHPAHPWDEAAVARFGRAYPEVPLILDHAGSGVRLVTKLKNFLLALFPRHAGRILRLAMPGGTPRWNALKRMTPQPVMLVNYVDGYAWLNGFPFFRSLVETHDVKFVKYWKSSGCRAADLRVLGKFRSEVAVLDHASGVIAIGSADRTLFQAISSNPQIFYIPSHAEIGTSSGGHAGKSADPAAAPAYDILFVGSGNRFNVDGLLGFLNRNRDWLSGRRMAVAGAVCADPEVRATLAAMPGVVALGFVDNLAPVYASARAVVSPVDGTGLKIKVVEALARGKPVFASAHSRECLPPGYEGCVFDIDATTMTRMLADDAGLAEAGRAAREYHRRLLAAGDRERLTAAIRQLLEIET